MRRNDGTEVHEGRRAWVLVFMTLAMVALVGRAAYLQIMNRGFLQGQGDARYLRTVAIPAHRGRITDRNGEPLAVSTPVESAWANPQELAAAPQHLPELARVLGIDRQALQQRVAQHAGREFMYLKRHLDPDMAERVRALNVPGVALLSEYRRYYPAGEVTAHVLGMTNLDDVGQEGLELTHETSLRGVPGSMRVIKDRLGRSVETVERLSEPVPGQPLKLSIDRSVQYLAYRSLKAAVQKHGAASGSAVVLDVNTGEVLAMVNQPSFNPNNRDNLRSDYFRNRAVTDVFEPGSTVKAFTVAAGLLSGKYRPDTPIDTRPGTLQIGPNTIHDVHNYGLLDVTGVIRKSSNVGVTKMAMTMSPEQLWNMFSGVGLREVTGSGFPGEVKGAFPDYRRWYPIDRASFSFGYGLSVTPLQLARAYAALADGGRLKPVSLVPVETAPEGVEAIPQNIAAQVLAMLETVTEEGGTAEAARVTGYRIAGKTGTVRKNGTGGYADDRYVSLFAGIAPVSRPRLAMVVMVNDPDKKEFYGGVVAAPVFSEVMAGALRLLDVPPDDLPGARIAHMETGYIRVAHRGAL